MTERCANPNCGHDRENHGRWGCFYVDDLVSVCPCNCYEEPDEAPEVDATQAFRAPPAQDET